MSSPHPNLEKSLQDYYTEVGYLVAEVNHHYSVGDFVIDPTEDDPINEVAQQFQWTVIGEASISEFQKQCEALGTEYVASEFFQFSYYRVVVAD